VGEGESTFSLEDADGLRDVGEEFVGGERVGYFLESRAGESAGHVVLSLTG